MSGLQSNRWQLGILPVLLLAALLFPTLHLHPLYERDDSGHLRHDAIIHADFLSLPPQDHKHLQHENVALGDSTLRGFSQSNLVTLPARGLESLVNVLETVLAFLTFDLVGVRAQAVKYGRFLKREHPPPRHPVFLTPNSPRSPPNFAFA
jgi:hypothetical protein